MLTDGIGATDHGVNAVPKMAQKILRHLGQRLLVGFPDRTKAGYRAVNALVITPDGFAMLLENGELVLNSRQIASDITGISVFCDQFERHFLAAAAYEQGDMRLLHAFGLVDGTAHLVVFAFKD